MITTIPTKENTMRKQEEIRADIDKLVKELDAVKVYDSKVKAAVNILQNLGWTHSPTKGWVSPTPAPTKKAAAPVIAGALAAYDGTGFGGIVYIRRVIGVRAEVSWAKNVTTRGAHISNDSFMVLLNKLTVKPREYFIGR